MLSGDGVYYRVRWRKKESEKWVYSWQHHMNEEEARKCLRDDVTYFYDDIEIQLIKCHDEIVETRKGSHKR